MSEEAYATEDLDPVARRRRVDDAVEFVRTHDADLLGRLEDA